MRYVLYFFWIMVILLGMTFALLNPQKITLNYYLGFKNIHLPLLLVITSFIGALMGILVMLPTIIRNKCRIRRLRNQLGQMEKEVQNLRSIPIKGLD